MRVIQPVAILPSSPFPDPDNYVGLQTGNTNHSDNIVFTLISKCRQFIRWGWGFYLTNRFPFLIILPSTKSSIILLLLLLHILLLLLLIIIDFYLFQSYRLHLMNIFNLLIYGWLHNSGKCSFVHTWDNVSTSLMYFVDKSSGTRHFISFLTIKLYLLANEGIVKEFHVLNILHQYQ